jgi:hypothetical protein
VGLVRKLNNRVSFVLMTFSVGRGPVERNVTDLGDSIELESNEQFKGLSRAQKADILHYNELVLPAKHFDRALEVVIAGHARGRVLVKTFSRLDR